MNTMLNHFVCFCIPYFTIHKFLYLSFNLVFKRNEINVNSPNFCPPVYYERGYPILTTYVPALCLPFVSCRSDENVSAVFL